MSLHHALVATMALALLACEGPPVEIHDGETLDESAGETPVEPLTGFSWVLDGTLAAMPMPGQRRPLVEDLGFLASQNIHLLVSLTEEPTDLTSLQEQGIERLHLPVKDFSAPTLEQMVAFVDAVEARRSEGEAVGVHCLAGLGRTGTMVASYLVAQGLSAQEALIEIRRLRPGSVETESQEEAIASFADSLIEDPILSGM